MSRNIPDKIFSLDSFSITQSTNDLLSNEICCLFRIPHEILQIITNFLNISDLQSLSKTCLSFYTFFNDNNFWNYRIHKQFPQSIVQFYTSDIFNKPEVIQVYNQIQQTNFAHSRAESEFDNLAITSATHYNDDAIESSHRKMYVSKEDFLNNLEYYQYDKPSDYTKIPFMKLIYFYLIDRKRCAVVNMNVIHRDDQHLVEEFHEDSLTGRIIHLKKVCWLEINGRFEFKIMPGKYEISWRIKCNPGHTYIDGETEFIVVPQHGKLSNYKITQSEFENLIFEHKNDWFIIKTGHTIIYEPSIVLTTIRNWNTGHWKYDILWDCTELTLIP
ncbi:unnamed protein product [Adineta steineri]|uniref:F-box domain-containing protein n=1 Tax=Adineta steineri TaxID=433720 RepID=A0A815KUU4_9BILA|nr:unnamed protein product [Adineta steineri]